MQKNIAATIILLLAIKLIISISSPFPISPDEYQRESAARTLIDSKFYPETESYVAPSGAPLVYPPLPDFLLAVLSFSGFELRLLMQIVSFTLFFAFLLLFYLFTKNLSEKQQILSMIFLALTPIILKRFTSFVNEIFGLTLLLLLIYLILSKKNFFLISLAISAAFLAHFRSFTVISLILIIYLIHLFLGKKSKDFRNLLKSFLVSGILLLPFILFNFSKYFSAQPVVNPWINFSFYSIHEFFGVIQTFFFILTLYFILFRKEKFDLEKDFFKLNLILFFTALILFLGTLLPFPAINQPYRYVVFLLIPLSVFTAVLIDSIAKLRKNNFLFYLILILLVFSVSLPVQAFDEKDFKANEFIEANFDSKTIIAEHNAFPLLLKGFKLVIAPLMERVPNATERMFQSIEFLEGKRGLEFSSQFNVECIISRNENKLSRDVALNSDKLYQNSKNSFYCLKI